jgi:hypothetical protein
MDQVRIRPSVEQYTSGGRKDRVYFMLPFLGNDRVYLSFIGNAGASKGYITAWFMHHLEADEYAGDAFIDDCEICSNSNWDVTMKNF